MTFETIAWDTVKKCCRILDQTRLPTETVFEEIYTVDDMIDAIRKLKVRGAPLIGVAAAYGAVLAAVGIESGHKQGNCRDAMLAEIERLGKARPTAVNLMNICARLRKSVGDFFTENESGGGLANFMIELARNIHREDAALCEAIGNAGESLLVNGDTILTHCNAGSLATSAWGTALAIIYKAWGNGKKITVYSDETRPLLQGSRLTAWELSRCGIPVYVICDNMAGYVMKLGKVNMVIVGADRICKNGDFANKIGTYSLAVLAKRNGIPFYVAAPSTTFDLECPDGDAIPIEERNESEVTAIGGIQTAPSGVSVFNPAFDVTENELVTAFITEKGVHTPPYDFNAGFFD